MVKLFLASPGNSIHFEIIFSLCHPFDSPLQPVKAPPSEKKKADNTEVRSNVKKTLAECLTKRMEETKDEFPNVTDEYIKNLVSDIEKELYVHFGKVSETLVRHRLCGGMHV